MTPDQRAYFEPRFGRDLSGIRIHTDDEAASAAQGINARAYTYGRDIAFAPGEYRPQSNAGRHLFAHELAHALQQSAANTLLQRQPDDQAEIEMPTQWAFALDASKRTDKSYARRLARSDAARIRKAGSFSAQEREEINAKLSFFDGDAWQIYSQTVRPALIAATHVIQMPTLNLEDDEPAAPQPRPARLLSLDYSGPEVCGGQPCFTDDMITDMELSGASEENVAEAVAAQLPEPVGQIGGYHVSVGPLSEEERQTPVAPAAAVAASPGQLKTPPPERIVLGGSDRITARAAVDMSKQTGKPIVGLGEGALAGAREITLIAHGNEDVVRIGSNRLMPADFAKRLISAGWRGGIVRLVSCETGVVGGPPTYAQQLANELAALGVESAVIAPKGEVFAGGRVVGPLPRVLPPGATRIPANLRKLGGGWGYVVPEIPVGPAPPAVSPRLPTLHPNTVTGAGWAGTKMAAMTALSYVHAGAVAERAQAERAETGFGDWGPTGSTAYDLGAWFLDPTDEAGRSIPLSQRFDMTVWRRYLAAKAAVKPVGEKWKLSFTTQGKDDPTFGNPTYRRFYGIYVKRPDGYWSTWGCSQCESGDFPPDLNKILDPFVSDEELREYLELPTPSFYDSEGLSRA